MLNTLRLTGGGDANLQIDCVALVSASCRAFRPPARPEPAARK
jgi:hypothetical protein